MGLREWWHRAQFPLSTVGFFFLLAAVLWVNAAINGYRFNVAVALVATVPLAFLGGRGFHKARARPKLEA